MSAGQLEKGIDVVKSEFRNKDILTASQFSRGGLLRLFAFAERMRPIAHREVRSEVLSGYVMGSFFFRESTRTRISSETAFLRLGGNIVTFTDMQYSSMSKGESFEDTMCTLDQYCDIMTLRLEQEGQAALAANIAERPVVNGGDGSGEHPTQALLDVFTFYDSCDFNITNHNTTVALVGDLKYGRTVHSLVPMLSEFCDSVDFRFVAPEFLQIPADILSETKKRGVKAQCTDDFQTGISRADIIYMVRPQLERMTSEEEKLQWHEVESQYHLNRHLLENCKPGVIITHPGPRNSEIATDVDKMPNAVFRKRQVANGVIIRMALYAFILGKEDKFV